MGDHKRLRIDVLLHHVVGQMMTSYVYYNQSYGAITRIGHPPLFTHAPKVAVKGTSNKVTTQSSCPSIPTTSDFSFFSNLTRFWPAYSLFCQYHPKITGQETVMSVKKHTAQTSKRFNTIGQMCLGRSLYLPRKQQK